MLCSILTACAEAGDAPELDESSTLAIQGGKPESGYRAVGIVDPETEACTGTLIAPNLVLTAAHCVMNVGSGGMSFAVDGYPRPHETDMSCTKIGGNLDLAVLRLKTPVTDVAPMPLRYTVPPVGTPTLAVGYGNHKESDGTTTSGRKRSATGSIKSALPGDWLKAAKGTGIADAHDSGGPLIYRDPATKKEFVIGVVHNHLGTNGMHEVENYSPLDRAWIEQAVAALQGPSPETLFGCKRPGTRETGVGTTVFTQADYPGAGDGNASE